MTLFTNRSPFRQRHECDADFIFGNRHGRDHHDHGFDTLRLQIRKPEQYGAGDAGNLLKSKQDNRNVLRTFDLTSFKGQTIRIYFLGQEDFAYRRRF